MSQSCEFVKKRDDTVLRVVWNGDLRLVDTGPKGGSARRWFFTINGKECSEARTIDTQLLVRDSGNNIHRPAHGGLAYSGVSTHNYSSATQPTTYTDRHMVGWHTAVYRHTTTRPRLRQQHTQTGTWWVGIQRCIDTQLLVRDSGNNIHRPAHGGLAYSGVSTHNYSSATQATTYTDRHMVGWHTAVYRHTTTRPRLSQQHTQTGTWWVGIQRCHSHFICYSYNIQTTESALCIPSLVLLL